jgi:hypothetical protein
VIHAPRISFRLRFPCPAAALIATVPDRSYQGWIQIDLKGFSNFSFPSGFRAHEFQTIAADQALVTERRNALRLSWYDPAASQTETEHKSKRISRF